MALFLQILISSSCLLNLILGLVVLRRNKLGLDFLFILLAFINSSWNLVNILFLLNPSLIGFRLTYAFGSLVLASSFAWVLYFTKKNSKIIIFTYFLGFINFGLSLSPLIIKNVVNYTIAGQNIQYGLLYNYFCFFFVTTLLAGIILLLQALSNPSINKNQTKFILLGILLFGFFALFFNTILPIFNITNLMNLDSTSTIFFVGFSAYAITKHRLMDIRALVIKSVIYSILIGVVATAYIGVFYFATQSYGQLINKNVLFVVTGFILVFSFQPLRRLLEAGTDRIFFKGHYNFRELLGNISDMLATKLSLDDLADTTLLMLTESMRITRGAVVLINKERITDIKALDFSKSKNIWAKVVGLTLEKNSLLVTDEFWEESAERKILRNMKIEVIVPLKNEEEIVGILVLGEKRSGDMYTPEDLKLLEILAPQTAIALQNALLFQDKERRIKELDALNKLALHVGSTLHLDKILDAVLEEAIDVTEAECGSIMLVDEDTNTLSIKTGKGIDSSHINKKIKVGEGIAGWVAKHLEPLNIDGQNKKFKPFIKREELTSSLSVPLIIKDKFLGVLNVNRRKKRIPFTDENLHLMTSFAAQAAEAIENAHLYENLEKTFMQTISALAAAVDAKDHYTFGHSEAVTLYSMAIAKAMKLSIDEVNQIEVAGKLHDIGKIGIQENILNKPGRLSEDERKTIEEHPKIGVDILKSVQSLKEIVPLILYHHERIDGLGYPTGMPGHIIPLGAKILAVADSFDAMTSNRPYRKALPVKIAVEELIKCSGTQFDTQAVDTFVELIKSGEFKKFFTKVKKRHLRAVHTEKIT